MRPVSRLMAISAALLIASAAPALAAPISLQVTLDTSDLVAAGIFTVDFQLNDGGGGPSGTSLSLTSFSFGGGASAGGETYSGPGASGTFGTGITLTDAEFLNQFLGDFTPGSSLSFIINGDGPAQSPPDLFTMAILDPDGFEIETAGPFLEFLSISFDGEPLIETFASTDGDFTVPAPLVESMSAVPEPSALLLVGSGVVGLAVRLRRRLRQSTS